jgi:hypothetical protein
MFLLIQSYARVVMYKLTKDNYRLGVCVIRFRIRLNDTGVIPSKVAKYLL